MPLDCGHHAFTLLLRSNDPDVEDVTVGTITADINDLAKVSTAELVESLGHHLVAAAPTLKSGPECSCQ